MKFNPDIHNRRSIRLKDYDYAKKGLYFITIVTQYRECLFGEVIDGHMKLNDSGHAVLSVWDDIPVHYPGAELDTCVIMPNHLHGIVVLNVGAGPCARPGFLSLPDVMQRFKSMSTHRYKQGVIEENWRVFPGRLWQRGYYERIIRNNDELQPIREYIHDNPRMWATDEENPTIAGKGE
ncbi:MAG: transposase [Nitrospirae bacterium]|nr:transposase [Nitrospirota bacterium]